MKKLDRYFKILTFIVACLLAEKHSYAQPVGNDTILLGAIVMDNDTFPMVFLPDFVKTDKLPRRFARAKKRYDRLHYNVYKVYPYAIMAAEVLKDVDTNLIALSEDKKERKTYLKSLEKQLNTRFKGELEDLTITQGQILVKLINRQTGKNCYSIIKELKGGFSAVIWQSVALIFSNNLKREYDPYDRDADIEAIVTELEANYYYNYKYQRQQALLRKQKNIN